MATLGGWDWKHRESRWERKESGVDTKENQDFWSTGAPNIGSRGTRHPWLASSRCAVRVGPAWDRESGVRPRRCVCREGPRVRGKGCESFRARVPWPGPAYPGSCGRRA